ncbi:MAG: LysR family transcriptional regulator, partial [Myxococcaceae bacterium]|nr:LysR family transcriptional regulator [Myxococcaceae bacterium]
IEQPRVDAVALLQLLQDPLRWLLREAPLAGASYDHGNDGHACCSFVTIKLGHPSECQQLEQMGIICYIFDPMAEPVETSELLAFTRTVEAKSLSRAAAELGAPRATIGRRLARLEERLGVRLLRRTTRALALTDAGRAFYRHARIVLDAVAQAEASVRKSDTVVRGTLRVATPPMLDPTFNALVCDFALAYPAVQIQVDASSRYVDLLREGYDVALRAGTELEPGLVARTLARSSAVAVAAPAYLTAHGTPKKARDLRAHQCLVGFMRDGLPQTHWPKAGGGKISVEGSLIANDITLLMDAALRGLGIAVLPTLLVGTLIERGELVRVLPDVIQAESRVTIVYQEKELLPPQVRAFIDALVAWAPAALAPARVLDRRCPPKTSKVSARRRSAAR